MTKTSRCMAIAIMYGLISIIAKYITHERDYAVGFYIGSFIFIGLAWVLSKP